MKRTHAVLLVLVLSGSYWLAPSRCRAEDDAAKPEANTAEKTQPQRQLSPELAALRDQVRRTLASHHKQAFNTRDNSASEILSHCLAFGCNSEVGLEGANGRRLNGITSLCWNYPCYGYEMLGISDGRVAARIGYGSQERPGEFLATLALSRVPEDYPVRSGKAVRTVADMVEAEKLACRAGGENSLRLVGLAYYVEEPEWKNDLGETWSIERILQDEMKQPVVTAPEGGLNRLMGLSYAVARRAKRGLPIDGQYDRARKFTAEFHDYAVRLQNADGSWGPNFLAAHGAAPDVASQLRSTGRIFEWLAISLPDNRMEAPAVLKGVECLTRLLGSQRYQGNVPSLPTREIASVGHALHGLSVYDERVFKPADAPAEEPSAAGDAPASAQHDTNGATTR